MRKPYWKKLMDVTNHSHIKLYQSAGLLGRVLMMKDPFVHFLGNDVQERNTLTPLMDKASNRWIPCLLPTKAETRQISIICFMNLILYCPHWPKHVWTKYLIIWSTSSHRLLCTHTGLQVQSTHTQSLYWRSWLQNSPENQQTTGGGGGVSFHSSCPDTLSFLALFAPHYTSPFSHDLLDAPFPHKPVPAALTFFQR